jgi:LacI family transcriptional regulator
MVDVIEGMNSSATGCEAVSAYLIETPRTQWPEVFYASNTVLLHGIFEALRRRSLSVPDDIAVVAFDDFEWAEMIDPPVTVIDQDIVTIGRAAGTRLLQQIKGSSDIIGEELILKPTLRVRQSCGCGRIPGMIRR